MTIKSLLGGAAILAGVFFAGRYLSSPKEVIPWYLNWDIYQDIVIRNNLNESEIFLGSPNGYIPLRNSGLNPEDINKVKNHAESYFQKRADKEKQF